MATALENAKREVQETKTVWGSVKALLVSLAERLRSNAGNPAEVQAIADELDTMQAEMAAAVVANTVAAGAPGESGPPPTGEV